MKRLVAILFVFYYLTSTVGFTISIHYCDDDIHSVAINSEAQSCCGDETNCCDCCDDEYLFLKADTDVQLASFFKTMAQPEVLQMNLLKTSKPFVSELRLDVQIRNLDLPPPDPEPIWLENCSLVFYG